MTDPYEEARAEAIWGLAKRKDPEGLQTLIDRLEQDEYWIGDEYAAQDILGLDRDVPAETLCDGLRRLL